MLHFFSNDGNSSIPFDDFAFADAERTHYISTAKCFLYPKDMTKGYCVGTDTELAKAVKADIAKQSAAEYYMHKPEDEIGVLSFGLSTTSYAYDEGLAYGEVEDGYNPFTDEGAGDITEPYKDGSYSEKISWNISSWDIKAVVVTKDMTNTIKYLESHKGENVFNLGTGTGYSVLDMVHAFERVTGQKVPYEIVGRRPGDLATVYADPSKAERELHWKKPTTYTVLRKLCEKGLLKNENGVVSSLISREEFYSAKSEQIIEESFEGSLPAFIASFISRKNLTAKEAEEIQRMIDAFKKEG
mgnify:CR=1 FL=1